MTVPVSPNPKTLEDQVARLLSVWVDISALHLHREAAEVIALVRNAAIGEAIDAIMGDLDGHSLSDDFVDGYNRARSHALTAISSLVSVPVSPPLAGDRQ